jgi:hypothetical protein
MRTSPPVIDEDFMADSGLGLPRDNEKMISRIAQRVEAGIWVVDPPAMSS